MQSKKRTATFLTLLFSGFIDYAGIAIVYPVFAYLLFDKEYNFFSAGTSDAIKGLWLGILIALYPMMQFFSAPVMGMFSDLKGRKNVLLISLVIALSGYIFALIGVSYGSLLLLALYRILGGIAAGNGSVIGAMVADLSTSENKARNFGLLGMSFGAGFTIAPFLGGIFVKSLGYIAVFWIPLLLVLLNIILVIRKLDETRAPQKDVKITLFEGFYLFKEALVHKTLKGLFLGLLIYTIGWAFFTEFTSLFLLDRYGFLPSQAGLYYGYGALFYSLFAGFFVSPLAKRLGPERALFIAQFFSGFSLLMLLFIYKPLTLWIYTPFIELFMAFVYPTTSTIISNNVSPDVQGRAMGIYQSINALGLAVSPFLSGGLIGVYPWFVILGGGVIMMVGALAFRLFHEPLAQQNH